MRPVTELAEPSAFIHTATQQTSVMRRSHYVKTTDFHIGTEWLSSFDEIRQQFKKIRKYVRPLFALEGKGEFLVSYCRLCSAIFA
jgi:hypothetical protein